MTSWWCEHAWVADGVVPAVRVLADDRGRITSVQAGVGAEAPDQLLPGLVLPGFANTHSHAFHRALRGRAQELGGTFWSWRERMYALAARLDPDTYLQLATAVYAEMALSGISCVGEFHYLHHAVGGARYEDPNEMGLALKEAARRAGIRLTLLDCCYLTNGIGVPLQGVQRRFDDGDAEGWASRVSRLAEDDRFRVGAAIHSVRGVPADQVPDVVTAAQRDDGGACPLHVHLSEQPAENEACRAAYGATPTELLADRGALGPDTTAVHAIHLEDKDVTLLGSHRTTVCVCPTTERDLGDGIGPVRALADAGSPVALGTDQHASVDMFIEARGMEMHERLLSGRRGRFAPAELVAAMAGAGHAALGWPEAGRIAVGAPADLVALRVDSQRTAGVPLLHLAQAATVGDVATVVVGGRVVARDGRHARLGDVGELLRAAVLAAWA